MLPQFVILGAQKAGSTFIFECLKEHPRLYMPRFETEFFEDPFYNSSQLAELEALFENCRTDQLRGIKRPDYLPRPECPARLKLHLPQAKFIVVLREPIARMISAFFWYVQVGLLPVMPLDIGFERLTDGRLISRYPQAQDLIEYGYYYQHIVRYWNLFARDQFHIILYDDLRADPLTTVQRAYQFLGVDSTYIPAFLEQKPKQSVYAPQRLRWFAFANRHFFYTQVPYAVNQIALRPKASRLLRIPYYGFVAVDRLLLARLFHAQRPVLSPPLTQEVAKLYREDINALEAALERDLSVWRR
ncbi:MAG: sulfotransferase domain-containing protein [Anaerolineae bacterium]|nr:sulfotransferase domain-containing protein [Anaerolineae bacterium]MCO5187405.1 sulfotransferase domain-containing protein [Anaerolineae bacterium]MCO5198848.1 sulfotransferase domain-containing protein [Anaerolineae bacterium]